MRCYLAGYYRFNSPFDDMLEPRGIAAVFFKVPKALLMINGVEKLAFAFGEPFVIRFVNAVSAVSIPNVPMEPKAEKHILERTARKLQNGSKVERLVSKYSLDLVQGPHKNLLERTKFETFIWKLRQEVGKVELDDLIAKLYVCNAEEYGPNHSAMAFLLKNRCPGRKYWFSRRFRAVG